VQRTVSPEPVAHDEVRDVIDLCAPEKAHPAHAADGERSPHRQAEEVGEHRREQPVLQRRQDHVDPAGAGVDRHVTPLDGVNAVEPAQIEHDPTRDRSHRHPTADPYGPNVPPGTSRPAAFTSLKHGGNRTECRPAMLKALT
jgi:hypothetical protein